MKKQKQLDETADAMRQANWRNQRRREAAKLAWVKRRRRTMRVNKTCPIAEAFAGAERIIEESMRLISKTMIDTTDREDRARQVLNQLITATESIQNALAERIRWKDA